MPIRSPTDAVDVRRYTFCSCVDVSVYGNGIFNNRRAEEFVLKCLILSCFGRTRLKKNLLKRRRRSRNQARKEEESGDSASLVSYKHLCQTLSFHFPNFSPPAQQLIFQNSVNLRPFRTETLLFFPSWRMQTHSNVSLVAMPGKCLRSKYLHR